MKKIFLVIVSLLFITTVATAQQKVAYIYSEKIFMAMPAYVTAVKELDEYAKSAQETAKKKLEEVQSQYLLYKQNENTLTIESRNKIKKQIIEMENEANNYEENFFSEGGPMSIKKDELMKPLEDKVKKAIETIATADGYDMIFDLSVAQFSIYQKPSLDMTNRVIELVK